MNKSKKFNVSIFLLHIIRFIIIFGLCFIILKPIVQYFFYACMSPEDYSDFTVSSIPRHWSLYNWKKSAEFMNFFGSTGLRSLLFSILIGVIQTAFSMIIGYGLARFEFKGRNILVVFLFAVMLIPPAALQIPQYFQFRFFGIDGMSLNLINTFFPNIILSICGLGLKGALYIFLMRLMYMQLPSELENAAYIDGASVLRTFTSVIVPNSRSLMITIFLFSFCWTWTDTTYSTAFYPNIELVSNQLIRINEKLNSLGSGEGTVIYGGIMLAMIPMLILMTFCQKHIVKSIALSGLAN